MKKIKQLIWYKIYETRYMALLHFAIPLYLVPYTSLSQNVAINYSGNPPAASSMLDIDVAGGTSRGMLVPRVTTGTRPAAPATGLLIYSTDIDAFEYYNGSAWIRFLGGNTGWSTTGNAGTSPPTNFLGTTDNQALQINVNSNRSGYIDPSGIGITVFGYLPGTSTTATGMTLFGYRAGAANTGTYSTFLGYQAGFTNTSGQNNVAVGSNAFYSSSTGNNNTAVGVSALYTANAAADNTAIGYSALRLNTNGTRNTALGYQALYNNSTTNDNVGIGYQALYNTTGASNTGVGQNALYNNAAGTNNTAIGFQAGYGSALAAKSNNTFLGYQAGYNTSTGSNNVLVGYRAGDNITTGTGNIILGNDIDAPAAATNNQLSIGNLIFGTALDGTGTTVSTGNIGIGTNAPVTKLDVNGAYSARSSTAAAAAAVAIPNNVSLFRLTLVAGAQANALSVAAPQAGQYLTIVNADDNSATFAGTTIPATNGVGTYVYEGAVWRTISISAGGAAGWTTLGNAGTSAATNFIGTTDAVDWVMRTNNTERARILSAGNILFNRTTALYATDLFEAQGNATFPDAINGYTDQAAGSGVYADNSAATGTGLYAINSAANGASAGFALWTTSGQTGGASIVANLQNATYFSGTAISAITTSALASGRGVLAACDNATGIGVQGQSAGLNGTGVAGFTSGTGANAAGVYGQASAATGTALWGSNTAANGASVGFGGWITSNQSGASALAVNLRGSTYFTNCAIGAVTDATIAGGTGVTAQCNNATGTGLWGQSSGSSGTGVYGYASGATAAYGVYGNTNQATGMGAGGGNTNANGTGLFGRGNNLAGSYLVAGSGGAFTGLTTGVFAYNTSLGVSQAIYNNNAGVIVRVDYWSGATQFKIQGTGTMPASCTVPDLNGNHVVMYSPECPEFYFFDYGQAQLVNGRAHIELDPIFANSVRINEKHPLRVYVQLEGDCNGVYVTNKTTTGFDVVELKGGSANVPFQWSVVCNVADAKLPNGKMNHLEDIRYQPAPDPEVINNLPMEKRNIEQQSYINFNSKENNRIFRKEEPYYVKKLGL